MDDRCRTRPYRLRTTLDSSHLSSSSVCLARATLGPTYPREAKVAQRREVGPSEAKLLTNHAKIVLTQSFLFDAHSYVSATEECAPARFGQERVTARGDKERCGDNAELLGKSRENSRGSDDIGRIDITTANGASMRAHDLIRSAVLDLESGGGYSEHTYLARTLQWHQDASNGQISCYIPIHSSCHYAI